MSVLSRRERTVIGVGVAGLLALGGYLYVIEPMLARQREVAELIPIREATLERRRLMVAQREQLAEELDALGRKVETASAGFLSGPTAPLAASELQKLVKELAVAAEVDVRSERVMAPVDLTGRPRDPHRADGRLHRPTGRRAPRAGWSRPRASSASRI